MHQNHVFDMLIHDHSPLRFELQRIMQGRGLMRFARVSRPSYASGCAFGDPAPAPFIPRCIRSGHDTIENTDYFCGFLLQMWNEGGRKDHFWSEFNTKTLAERQIGDEIASTGRPRATRSPGRWARGWALFVWLKGSAFGYLDKNPPA